MSAGVSGLASCPRCLGAKTVTVIVLYGDGLPSVSTAPCPSCHGQGEVPHERARALAREKEEAMATMRREWRRIKCRRLDVQREATEIVVAQPGFMRRDGGS